MPSASARGWKGLPSGGWRSAVSPRRRASTAGRCVASACGIQPRAPRHARGPSARPRAAASRHSTGRAQEPSERRPAGRFASLEHAADRDHELVRAAGTSTPVAVKRPSPPWRSERPAPRSTNARSPGDEVARRATSARRGTRAARGAPVERLRERRAPPAITSSRRTRRAARRPAGRRRRRDSGGRPRAAARRRCRSGSPSATRSARPVPVGDADEGRGVAVLVDGGQPVRRRRSRSSSPDANAASRRSEASRSLGACRPPAARRTAREPRAAEATSTRSLPAWVGRRVAVSR